MTGDDQKKVRPTGGRMTANTARLPVVTVSARRLDVSVSSLAER
jgi:hypothetical protein